MPCGFPSNVYVCQNFSRKNRDNKFPKVQQTKPDARCRLALSEDKSKVDIEAHENLESKPNSSSSETEANNEDCPDDWETISDALTAKKPVKFDSIPQPRAWDPNDVLRPQCLPNPSLHKSCNKSVISGCPICFEDLDSTDSSFHPCPRGFHICLFCHKTILEADGRCPGCRNDYKPFKD